MRIAKNFTHRASRAFAIAAMAVGMHAAQAYSVSLAPASQTVFQGTEVQVAVTVADVAELMPGGLGSFDFTLGFDSRVLAFDSVLDGGVLGSSIFGLVPGSDSLEISDISFTDPAELLALQVDLLDGLRAAGNANPSLTLFTVSFRAIGVGTSALSFARGALSDVTASALAVSLTDGSVTVLENLTVPVPGTLGLVLAAGLVAAMTRRRLSPPAG